MPKCDVCYMDYAKLENWGQRSLCPKCSERWKKMRASEPPKDTYEIKLNPEYHHYGMYEIETGDIHIMRLPEKEIFDTLNHEMLHRIIHKCAGLRPCWQYDNISKHIEPHHSFE